jgi:hypothetical protein
MNFNGVPNVNMTTTVAAIMEQCKIHTKLQNFFSVGGIAGQPALRLCDNVQQMLLTKRMGWKFNRVHMGGNNPAQNPAFFISQQGFQDYSHAGATCFTLINSTTPGGSLPAGGAGVDLNPGVYQNGVAKLAYGTFNGGNAYGPVTSWQDHGIIFDPVTGNLTVQFLDPHPFLLGNIGTSIFLIQGVMNPAFNSSFVYNQLTQLSGWMNGYTLLSIPDQFHIVLAGNGGQKNTITNISASAGITTITLGSANSVPVYPTNFQGQYGPANTTGNGIGPGAIMTFTGVTTNSALNGVSVTILSATSTQLKFTTPTGVTITNGADTGTIYAASSGAPGIWNFGWIESAALIDINNPSFPLPVDPIDAVHRIAPEYTSTGDNLSISMELDYGNGVVLFRLSEPVSTYPFAFSVTYQAKAPKFINGQSVFQWPDDYSWVLFEMLLWQGMRFAYGSTAAETQSQMQVAMMAVQRALESEDREASEQGIVPNFSLMR